jgi:hypothetical protein
MSYKRQSGTAWPEERAEAWLFAVNVLFGLASVVAATYAIVATQVALGPAALPIPDDIIMMAIQWG